MHMSHAHAHVLRLMYYGSLQSDLLFCFLPGAKRKRAQYRALLPSLPRALPRAGSQARRRGGGVRGRAARAHSLGYRPLVISPRGRGRGKARQGEGARDGGVISGGPSRGEAAGTGGDFGGRCVRVGGRVGGWRARSRVLPLAIPRCVVAVGLWRSRSRASLVLRIDRIPFLPCRGAADGQPLKGCSCSSVGQRESKASATPDAWG